MATSVDITFRLYLRGDELIPDEISRHLGLEPTRTQTKGLPLSSANPLRLSKFGLWVFAREAEEGRYLLCDFLRELEAAASRSSGHPFVGVGGAEEAWIDIHYLQALGVEQPQVPDCELNIGAGEISALHALQLPLVVTFSAVRQ